MLKRHKDILRPLVAGLRATLVGSADGGSAWLRGDLDRELERLGVAPDGTALPHDVAGDPALLPARLAAEAYLDAAVSGAKGAEADQRRRAAREEFVERAAYTWINRLLALRAMEARGLIDGTLRANPEYDGLSEALYVLRHEDPARASAADGGWWAVLDDACAIQAEVLPGLFDQRDPAAVLRPSTAALLRCVAFVGRAPAGATLDEIDTAFADPDAIGWCYQFYQGAAKARVYARLSSGGKAATRSEIVAATQLFTEPYMVQWLLQNSLGRSYHEAYPDSMLPETWEYYIRPDHRPPTADDPPSTADCPIMHGSSVAEAPRPLEALDLIDPCCGSGHFLREAFDMYAAMYRERHPELGAAEIADRILSRHLHGIDLDPRAAQLTALTLYLRAWEFIRDENKRQRTTNNPSPIVHRPLSTVYRPSSINIATTPSGLSAGTLQRHLRRYPGDRVLKPLLEGVFAALEQADILGSLLRPAEHIDAVITALQQPHTMQIDFDTGDAQMRRTMTALANSDPAELKKMLLDRVAQSFAVESGEDNVAARLFGREAQSGASLLQLLDRKYAVVVTNPPYMGSGNMDAPLKKYVEQHYKAGKRDLYAALILRCLELCYYNGRVGMVTQQSWIFTRSYTDLRAVPDDKLVETRKSKDFTGLLRETAIEALAHLGSNAFEEISGEVVQTVLLILSNRVPEPSHFIISFRLVGIRAPLEKAVILQKTHAYKNNEIVNTPRQLDFLHIEESPIAYYLGEELISLLIKGRKLKEIADVRTGLQTSDNERFTRCFWEAISSDRWFSYAKGGGYAKWAGLDWLKVDWEYNGSRVYSLGKGRFQAAEYYFAKGLTYSPVSGGALGFRLLNSSIFDVKGSSLFLTDKFSDLMAMAVCLNSHVCSYLARAISRSMELHVGYLAQLPLPKHVDFLSNVGRTALAWKSYIVSQNSNESAFSGFVSLQSNKKVVPLLHTLEGFSEQEIFNCYKLSSTAIQTILAETGTPAGFHPLIAGYDALPELPADLDLPPLPQEVIGYLAEHQRITLPSNELARLKARLRALYEAGPGAKEEAEEASDEGGNDEEAAVSGAHIPIPTETFLEALSVKLEVHPISIYWLLEELRAGGARCKPEELRLLEDRLTVLVLRLFGHRWPREIEEERGSETQDPRPKTGDHWQTVQNTVPSSTVHRPSSQNHQPPATSHQPPLADNDGIIPLIGGTGEPTVAERVRGRLRDEDGELSAQQTEALLQELTGLSLEEWLRRTFFKRHIRQFKYRPIAWHLASKPIAESSGRGRRQPAFECLVYYHACGGDVLARIRIQYVEPLLRAERHRFEGARKGNQETEAAQALTRIQELEEFNRRLQDVAEHGFTSPELAKSLAGERLDRWSGDGLIGPASAEELLHQERAWQVDLNDGVRVNIAPVQLAGLLAADVLKAADAKKAIDDRARWRSDERGWVRQGKLPRCGWMPDDIPESPAWVELAPQREAERIKLEEKRRAVGGRGLE